MRKGIMWVGLFTLLVIFFSSCNIPIDIGVFGGHQTSGGQQNASAGASGAFNEAAPDWGHQTKTTGCQAQGPIQDKECTPGNIFANLTREQVCTPGYASSVRNVAVSTKNLIYASYGITKRSPGQYQIDHLVSLKLGGTNDISNLWPESATPVPGYHEKDKVENYLSDQVCSGKLSLKDAQIQIATNWLEVYNRMPDKSSNKYNAPTD
ncbi:HNH endonuclease signature motif containing protein [Dictyobacter kobayashii]|uniref:Uncharacterized protein n=1 Tax=Dictyobacter kobayashii TaxID=2014872 RepID=A0A402AWR8_9CHLR|nr:HNH endonuclease signature motif containing protein [Dictyobacter kobayashii]GCE23537.1 hypothetical protein KDK_73370 [Dictyobacter kobayashii]